MSLLDSIRHSLDSMGFLQLSLVFAAMLGYAIALGPSFPGAARAGAAITALLSALGFAAASPEWTVGVVLMALAVAAFGLFAGSSWLLSRLLGVGETRGRLAADTPFVAADAVVGWRGGRVALANGLRPAAVGARPS